MMVRAVRKGGLVVGRMMFARWERGTLDEESIFLSICESGSLENR